MIPTDILKHEHQVILLVIGAAEKEAAHIGETGALHAENVEKMLDFFKNFADKCHHAKEENHLFTKMVDRGMPLDSGPIAVMLHEHHQGRQHVKGLADALPAAKQGDAKAVAAVRDNLLGYAALLRQHIDKEDNVLYPMADRMFTDADQKALGDAFDKVEAEEMGEGTHEKFHQIAHDLAKA